MFLKRIQISQIRAIDNVALDFISAASTRPGFLRQHTVMVGDNHAGKSTALRAIALVLAGSDALAGLLQEPARWVRNGQKEGRISATLVAPDGREFEAALMLNPSWNVRKTLTKNEQSLAALNAALASPQGGFLTLGYGVARRPALEAQADSNGSADLFAHPRARHVATLFSPDATLAPLREWAQDSAALRSMLKVFLPGMTVEKVDHGPKGGAGLGLLLKTVDGSIPFSQLSDATQTLVNLFGDVLFRISNASKGAKNPLKTSGVLLIDELELHLHPVWQRTLVASISAAYPNLQIIGTTQSPMVAQQLRDGELVLLQRAFAKVGATSGAMAGDPSQLTLSQLVGSVFGIGTGDSERVAALRSRARSSPAMLAAHEHIELAQLAPVHELSAPMQAQLAATTALTEAIARSAGQTVPKLDPAKLRQKMGERIKLAALRAGAAS